MGRLFFGTFLFGDAKERFPSAGRNRHSNYCPRSGHLTEREKRDPPLRRAPWCCVTTSSEYLLGIRCADDDLKPVPPGERVALLLLRQKKATKEKATPTSRLSPSGKAWPRRRRTRSARAARCSNMRRLKTSSKPCRTARADGEFNPTVRPACLQVEPGLA